MVAKPVIVNTDYTSGNTNPIIQHCWPPAQGVPLPLVKKVFINNDKIPVVVGDFYSEHPGPCPTTPPIPPTGVPPHSLTTGNIFVPPTAGNLKIFVEDKPMYLTGTFLSCGDNIDLVLGGPAQARNVWIEV